MLVSTMRRRPLFPSPVFFDRPPAQDALRGALRQRFLRESAGQPDWQGPPGLFERPEPAFSELFQLVMSGLQDAIQQQGAQPTPGSFSVQSTSWASVLLRGGYRPPQRHAGAHWAGLYVIDAGDQSAPPPSGCLTFLDPRGARKDPDPLHLFSVKHDLMPADGLLLLFPGWLLYHLHPHTGDQPRILVTFTLTLS